jgi:hypothetical protein
MLLRRMAWMDAVLEVPAWDCWDSNGMQNKLAWWEPPWSYRPGLRKAAVELARAVPVALGITAAIVLLLVYLCNRYRPNLQFDWLRAVAICIGFLAVYLGLLLAAAWLIPPRVSITAKRVSWIAGERCIVWRFDRIHSARIIEIEPGQLTLVIQNVDGRERRCGISSHVSLDELREMFGAKWNASPLPPNTTNKEKVAAMQPWMIACVIWALVVVLVPVVTKIIGVSRAVMEVLMWVTAAVGAAIIVIFIIKAYKFDRAHRSAQKKLREPEK